MIWLESRIYWKITMQATDIIWRCFSSCLLEERFEKSIVAIREQLGGQWLGMTRFMDGLDDWPAYNYAIYLMERGEIPRFQLLFYSHIRYHGNQNFHLYYEQVKCLDHGMRKTADSSVPCCALPVMMMTMNVLL